MGRRALFVVAGSVALLAAIGGVGLWGALRIGPPNAAQALFDSPILVPLLAALTAIDVAILAFATPTRSDAWLSAFVFALTLAVVATELRRTYPVGSTHSFPNAFATFHLKNFNLTESLVAAQNILRGRGNTLSVAGGTTKIDTYRMPGYPLLIALSGKVWRVSPEDTVGLGTSTVYLQVWCFALAAATVAFALARTVPIGVAALIGAATCWMPQDLDLTQVDSIVFACGLLIVAALCPFCREPDLDRHSLADHILVHAAFGLYLLMRSDVLMGWFAVSLFLYRRRLVYLLWPACVFLVIGTTWGLYKKSHGSEFVMTTSNIGHVAFVGLWQTPTHKFAWQPSDESYAEWVGANGYTYMEPETNAFAMREVVRFWFTYPGYVIGNAWYKAYSYFRYESYVGSLALPPARWVGAAMRRGGSWLLFLLFVTAAIAGVNRRLWFLLGWPVLFDLPLFFILQHNERYVAFATWSLMAATAVALTWTGFRTRLINRRTAVIRFAFLGLAIWLAAPVVTALLMSDRFRYWTPILDPSHSTLQRPRPASLSKQ
jgi:hypothetical protein